MRYPRVLGHELIGTVVAHGPAAAVRTGDRVAVEPNYSCGACPLCREGNRNLCLGRVAVGIDVDGGFAERARCRRGAAGQRRRGWTTSRSCWPSRWPWSCAPSGGGGLPPARAQRSGVGSLGLLAVQVLRARGLRVLAVGRSGRRLDLARTLGALEVATTATGADARRAREFSGREGVDLVIETAGTPEAVAQAVDLVRPGGGWS